MAVIDKFAYSSKDFLLSSVCDDHKNCNKTKLEVMLCDGWDEGMKQGYFRYELNDVQSRLIPGERKYIVQFNNKRFVERRKPQMITHLREPFQPDKFNFTKEQTLMMINVSPIEYGHVLLVPNIQQHLNQVLTEQAIKYGIELMLLTISREFRVGFNSLCAHASVNHLHLHGWYVQWQLPTETCKADRICEDCFELRDSLVRGFAFEVMDLNNIDNLSRKIFQITEYFSDNEVAHNMYLTRGDSFSDSSVHGIVRILLWPRQSVFEMKEENLFNIAVAELSGYLPIRDLDGFKNITEKEIDSAIEEASLSKEQFDSIKTDIIKLIGH
ncbi:GDP-D-glucose phosphorylase 1-like isoform X2 [Tubulanus polymorphus]|uniref:GDP-D-glucose phosphorylase 1-like isoform X2 n=1 Tax=Tubulanus polymorphus TaxID=672921 RepID=UPI003DA61FCF